MYIVAKRLDGLGYLGTEVGLTPGNIVLDGNLAPPTERGTAAPPTFRLMSTLCLKKSPTLGLL